MRREKPWRCRATGSESLLYCVGVAWQPKKKVDFASSVHLSKKKKSLAIVPGSRDNDLNRTTLKAKRRQLGLLVFVMDFFFTNVRHRRQNMVHVCIDVQKVLESLKKQNKKKTLFLDGF